MCVWRYGMRLGDGNPLSTNNVYDYVHCVNVSEVSVGLSGETLQKSTDMSTFELLLDMIKHTQFDCLTVPHGSSRSNDEHRVGCEEKVEIVIGRKSACLGRGRKISK